MSERFVVGEEHAGERVDKALTQLFARASRASIQRWIREGRVRADGVVCTQRLKVAAGMVLDVSPGPEPTTNVAPDASVPFAVLFEDEHLIVVDKPAGVVVHPARGHWTGTLVAGLLARPGFRAAPADERDPEGHMRPGIVHRIDKETSGVLVVAKNAHTREGLKEQLATHSMGRLYQALTVGVPPAGEIRTLHGRHPRSRLKFSSCVQEGKPCITHVRVAEAFGSVAAHVECRLETGRTHQIRVHLSEQARAPILADALYGGPVPPSLEAARSAIGRHALHARALSFRHPLSGEPLDFDSAPPADFEAALSQLRALPG